MTSEDNATQGWQAKLNEFDIACADYGYYRSDSPEAIKARTRADVLHRELLAALQRPSREAELRAEIESLERSEARESERANFMVEAAERNLARAEAAEAREAALVEALKFIAEHCDPKHPGWVMDHVGIAAYAAKALISPPGLSA